jgi:hypothetical protein
MRVCSPLFVLAVAALTAACNTTPREEPAAGAAGASATAAAPSQLILTLRGGFVHVMSEKDGAMYSGPIKNTTAPHRVYLVVTPGTKIETSLPQLGADSYSLDGVVARWRVAFDDTEDQPVTGVPRLPRTDAATNKAPATDADWNNRYLVPDLAAIAQEATGQKYTLRMGWKDMLTGYLMFSGGTLTFARPVIAGSADVSWSFSTPRATSKPVRTQHMTNEVIYTAKLASPKAELVDANDRVLATLTPEDPNAAQPVLRARIEAEYVNKGTVGAEEQRTGVVAHFAHFYDLIMPSPASRPVPTYDATNDKTGFAGDDYCSTIRMSE